MKALRALLAGRLAARRPDRDFSWLTRHRGMFSLTGLDSAAIGELRSTHHVYVPPDGRINIAGVSEQRRPRGGQHRGGDGLKKRPSRAVPSLLPGSILLAGLV